MNNNSSVGNMPNIDLPSVADAYTLALKKAKESMMSNEFKKLYSQEDAEVVYRKLTEHYEGGDKGAMSDVLTALRRMLECTFGVDEAALPLVSDFENDEKVKAFVDRAKEIIPQMPLKTPKDVDVYFLQTLADTFPL